MLKQLSINKFEWKIFSKNKLYIFEFDNKLISAISFRSSHQGPKKHGRRSKMGNAKRGASEHRNASRMKRSSQNKSNFGPNSSSFSHGKKKAKPGPNKSKK